MKYRKYNTHRLLLQLVKMDKNKENKNFPQKKRRPEGSSRRYFKEKKKCVKIINCYN